MSEHMRLAERAYDKLRKELSPCDALVRCDPVLIDSLRNDAKRAYPLFPLVEAARGRFDR